MVYRCSLHRYAAVRAVCPAAPQSALQGVQQEIAQQASKVAAQQDQRQQLQQALRKQDQSISSASKALRQTEQRLTRLTRDLKRLTTSISELEKQQQQHQQRLAAQLDAAYRQGKQGQLQAMLSSDDPARAERMLHYYRAINEERQAVMNEISVNQHELQQQKDELQAKQKNKPRCWEVKNSNRINCSKRAPSGRKP